MLENDLKAYLIKLLEALNQRLKLKCVILFGSRARNDYLENSDLDIIFVGDFNEPFIERSSIIYEYYDLSIGLDAFCYTSHEFNNMFHEGIVSILNAIDHGICIFGRDFYNKYKDKMDKLKQKGLKREPPVWILPERMD